MVSPEDHVDAVEPIRPWASRLVVGLPLLIDVPVVVPWASLKVLVVPDELVVVEDLPFSSLNVAFL